MNLIRSINYLLSFFLVCLSITVSAEDHLPSTITLENGSNNANGVSRVLDINLALEEGRQFLFGMGSDKQKSGTDIYDTGFIYTGIGSDSRKPLSVKAMLEYSGKQNQLTIFSASFPVKIKGHAGSLTVTPVLRAISIYTVGNKKVNVSSPALGLSGTAYLGERGRVLGSAFYYNYSKNVAALTNLQFLRIFNEPTLMQASGFLKQNYLVETGMDYDAFSWSVGWNKSISAIAPAYDSEYAYLSTDFYLSDAWALKLMYGQYLKTTTDSHFSSLAISYTF